MVFGEKAERQSALMIIFYRCIGSEPEQFRKIKIAVYIALAEVEFHFVIKSHIGVMPLSERCHKTTLLIFSP
jgi:hypothetical protein